MSRREELPEATANQVVRVLERAAQQAQPEQRLFLAVIAQAVRDAGLKVKGDFERKAIRTLVEIREDARRFFFLGAYRRYAEYVGLDPAFIKETLIAHTTWAREEYFID